MKDRPAGEEPAVASAELRRCPIAPIPPAKPKTFPIGGLRFGVHMPKRTSPGKRRGFFPISTNGACNHLIRRVPNRQSGWSPFHHRFHLMLERLTCPSRGTSDNGKLP